MDWKIWCKKSFFNNGKDTGLTYFFCVEYHIRIRALLQHARTIKIVLILSKGCNRDTGRGQFRFDNSRKNCLPRSWVFYLCQKKNTQKGSALNNGIMFKIYSKLPCVSKRLQRTAKWIHHSHTHFLAEVPRKATVKYDELHKIKTGSVY